MPANNCRENNMFGTWPHYGQTDTQFSSNRSSPYNSRKNSPSLYPSSPINISPTTSPTSTLRRNYSSTFSLIPEDRELDNNEIIEEKLRNLQQKNSSLSQIIISLILWWPLLLQKITFIIIRFCLKIIFLPFSFATPTFWLSAFLWIFWKLIGFPLSLIKWTLYYSNQENQFDNDNNNNKRTILISCGSTIQTLHLARNFYSSGARVVVFEFEGLFGLSRFSKAVNKFYTVPRPTQDSSQEYITALCDIVEKEKPTYYIPVCATSPSYYDALAKPHLELLGCASFIPGLQENTVLDDIFEIIKKCQTNDIHVAQHKIVTSKDDVYKLYNIGWLNRFRNIITAIGFNGILEHQKYLLPLNREDLKIPHEISEKKPWLIMHDVPGNHYITCTTVKDSHVIANVTCLVNHDKRYLKPEENEHIETWLNEFFSKIHFNRPINGHISFRFVKCDVTGKLLPIGSRVGVSLPYICHTGVHSKVLCKPCKHFSRQNSGPLIQKGGRYWIHEAILNTLKYPSINAVGKLIETILGKREALFAYWDPLPYCAYYHFQLPLKSVKMFLQKRQNDRNKNIKRSCSLKIN